MVYVYIHLLDLFWCCSLTGMYMCTCACLTGLLRFSTHMDRYLFHWCGAHFISPETLLKVRQCSKECTQLHQIQQSINRLQEDSTPMASFSLHPLQLHVHTCSYSASHCICRSKMNHRYSICRSAYNINEWTQSLCSDIRTSTSYTRVWLRTLPPYRPWHISQWP